MFNLELFSRIVYSSSSSLVLLFNSSNILFYIGINFFLDIFHNIIQTRVFKIGVVFTIEIFSLLKFIF